MIEIVTNNNFDFDNYEYAICECTSWDEGIQVPRKKDNYFASFNCPRCGRELGLFVRQRNIKIDDDTVSRKAVLDAIMGEPTDAHYPSWYAERIKALPPSPTPSRPQEPQWIPCSKELPKIGNRVIGTYKNSLFENGPYVVRVMRREKKYWVGDDEHWFLYENILAWQPLPEPYKEGGAE